VCEILGKKQWPLVSARDYHLPYLENHNDLSAPFRNKGSVPLHLVKVLGWMYNDPVDLFRMSDITLMLQAIDRGEAKASEELLPLLYGELRRLAAARMAQEAAGHTLQPTALVHEAWLRLVGNNRQAWQNRAHFFGAAAEAMRRILIERARRKSRLKRGSNQTKVDISELELAAPMPDDKVLLVDEALQQFKAAEPEKARVVMLKFFGGLTDREVAEAIGVNERTVRRQWVFAKAWLFQHIADQG